jgi:hypothetical protein
MPLLEQLDETRDVASGYSPGLPLSGDPAGQNKLPGGTMSPRTPS